MASKKTIGILALQGNFAMHGEACLHAGAEFELVKTPMQLRSIDGLIFPGGESTTMLKHFEMQQEWWQALTDFHAADQPMFGTCAGLILLAQRVQPQQKSLGFLDVEVERNAYGRQIDSHNIHARFLLNDQTHEIDMPFIRAPKIVKVGAKAQPMGWVEDQVVMVQQGNVLGAACHPEASTAIVHEYFVKLCS